MHTPRFSGQPATAGDFVFIRTASRPILTSCENVGTVVPRSRAQIFIPSASDKDARGIRGSRKARTQNRARAQSSAERSTANPEIPPARNSVRTPRSRTNLLASVRRGLLGFAGLAPHSGRSSVPFRLTLFRDRRYFPSNSMAPNNLEPPHSGQKLPSQTPKYRGEMPLSQI